MVRYRYWTLRYLPDAVRGEFVNIGLIAGCDGADWAIRTISSFTRASRIGGDLSNARSWAKSLERTVKDAKKAQALQLSNVGISEAWLAERKAFHNNAVQLSEAMPVVAATAEAAVELLYPLLVTDPEPIKRSSAHARALEELKSAYQSLRGDRELLNKVKVKSGVQSMDFDFALSGQTIEQLSRVWTFEQKNAEAQLDKIQAWGFRVEQLRDQGGTLLTPDSRSIYVDPDVEVRVLYVPPPRTVERDTFMAALDSWQRIDAEALPVERAAELVEAG